MMTRIRAFYSVLPLVSVLAIAACTQKDVDDFKYKSQNAVQQDREIDYNRDQLRRAMAPRPLSEEDEAMGNVPDLAPVIAEEKKDILPQPLVSITVNQDVPLRDIFFELAKQAEVDLELDPTITGSVIFTAYNRPFDQVVERISDMAGLRYKFKNNILRVERDTPYLKTYRVDYLGMTRDYKSTINSNTSAASGSSGGGSNGSNSAITSESKSDFWGDLEMNITQIISNTNQQVSLTDQSAPVTTSAAIPAVTTDQLATVRTPVAPATGENAAPALPTAGLANPTGTKTVAGGDDSSATSQNKNPYFSLNKQAGLINVFATEKQHSKITTYLGEMRRAVNAQVLIEAKVFEVVLNDESATGIDWGAFLESSEFNLGLNLPRPSFTTNAALPSTGGIFSYNGSDFSVLIDALSRFGHVRALSSPRLTVMNNQTAVLNVSESRVFFDLEISRTEGTVSSPAVTDITSEAKNVPEGIIITVHPSIDTDTNDIIMNLRPSITRVVRTVSDPAVAYVSNAGNLGIESLVPELSVREIDSIVKMSSGQTIIMGGLMSDRVDSEQVSVPVLGETPLIGPLFRNQRDSLTKTELVIFLRAKVLDAALPDETDRRMYKELATDRRPVRM